MKAILVSARGGPEVLKYGDAPDPTPGEGEVLVRTKAIGVNHGDARVRTSGYVGNTPPAIPGIEAAGIVESVGANVQGFKPGDRVAGLVARGYAELATGAANWLFLLPPELSFEQGAAIPVGFATAWHGLLKEAGLRTGERVLIHAAGSGVGSAAIQVAKHFGGWVVATAGSDWKLDRARQIGADATVNYQTADFAEEVLKLTDGKGVDVVLEGVGGETFTGSVKCLASCGRVVVYGTPSGTDGRLSLADLTAKQAKILGISMGRNPDAPRTMAEVGEQAIPLFVQGRFQAVVHITLPLAQAAEAHRMVEAREPFGKIILTP